MLPSNQKRWSDPEYWIIIISFPQRENILSIFSLHTEHPFWDMWLWNSGTTVCCCCYYVDFQRRMWAGLACGTMCSGVNWVISFWESAGVIWTLYASIKCQKMDEKTYWKPDACSSCLLGHQKQAANKRHLSFAEFTHRWVWRHFAYW